MKIAIFESNSMPAGHEIEFDRIIVNELKRQNHEPLFFVPERFPFKIDFGVPVKYLTGGEVITYAGAGKLEKIWRSIKREKRRRAWFNSAYEYATKGDCDAIIIATATYRYINALLDSKLKNSPVPVYILFHGINPKEEPKFIKKAKEVMPYKNIFLKVISACDNDRIFSLPNVTKVVPPVYKPTMSVVDDFQELHNPIRLGFFGQFRKEKKLDIILEAFKGAKFPCDVDFIVQGATTNEENSRIFQELIARYKNVSGLHFIHKSLIDKEWEDALLSIDALVMPYGVERYRYHPSAMLFTALGFYKPVLLSSDINPEILQNFRVGVTCEEVSVDTLRQSFENLVASLYTEKEIYSSELRRANEVFSHAAMIRSVLNGDGKA